MTTLAEELENYYCSEYYYSIKPFREVVTDGVKAFIEKGNAFWAISEICINRMKLIEKGIIDYETPLFSRIESTGKKAKIFIEDGNGEVIKKRNIARTDLEKGTYHIWLMDNVFLLRSEY